MRKLHSLATSVRLQPAHVELYEYSKLYYRHNFPWPQPSFDPETMLNDKTVGSDVGTNAASFCQHKHPLLVQKVA